jgi:Na+/H+ antiporter NhaC
MEDADVTTPEEILKVSYKKNIIIWLIYSIISMILFIPFFYGEWFKHLSISLLTGFLFGMLNAIINELIIINTKNHKNES